MYVLRARSLALLLLHERKVKCCAKANVPKERSRLIEKQSWGWLMCWSHSH